MNTFRVVLEGRCIDGFTAEAVKTGLSRLMRFGKEVVEDILHRHETTVKKGLDQATGDHYLTALRAVGIACRLEPENLEFDIASGASDHQNRPKFEVERELPTEPSPVDQALSGPEKESLIPPSAFRSASAAETGYDRPKGDSIQGDKVTKIALGNLHPWRRFVAKLIDLVLIALIPFILLGVVGGYLFPEQLTKFLRVPPNPIIVGVSFFFIWMSTEIILLSVFGNTPARWLFGISVRSGAGGKLSFGKVSAPLKY